VQASENECERVLASPRECDQQVDERVQRSSGEREQVLESVREFCRM